METAPTSAHSNGPQAPPPALPRGPGWSLILAVWTLLGLFYASPYFLEAVARGESVPWREHLLSFTSIYVWAALTPLVHRVVRRHPPFAGGGWPRTLAAHAATLLGLIAVETTVTGALQSALLPTPGVSPARAFMDLAAVNFGGSFIWYAGLVGGLAAWDAYAAHESRQLRASRLAGRLAQAQLQLLRMQLQPHFLFNTLHTISALLAEDPPAAQRMLRRLTDLFRLSLQNAGAQEISLREELAFVDAYLDIERTRFHDRLSVAVDAAPETLDALVPSLLLQPLAENAVKHGISTRSAPGRIEILARRRNGTLVVQVRDDGPGLRDLPPRRGGGLGLSSTRARLQQLYGEAHRFTMYNSAGGGLRIVIEIPFRAVRAAVRPEPAEAPA